MYMYVYRNLGIEKNAQLIYRSVSSSECTGANTILERVIKSYEVKKKNNREFSPWKSL